MANTKISENRDIKKCLTVHENKCFRLIAISNMGTIHTRLRIVNETNTDIVSTSVSSTANFDWAKGTGPHRNFQNVFIGSGKIEERAEVLKKHASHCPFNMTLYYRDGSQDIFRIHQKYANGCCDGFNHMTRSHDIFYERDEGNCLKITIKNTEQQLQNEKAEQLKKEGEAAMRQQQFHTAMQKYEEALRLANQGHTIDSINAAKAAAARAQQEERATNLRQSLENFRRDYNRLLGMVHRAVFYSQI